MRTAEIERDIRLQIRIKNARILRAMVEAGIPTVSDLCRRMGSKNQSRVGELVNFKCRPVTSSGQWTNMAIAVAATLHKEPGDLWPAWMVLIRVKSNEVSLDLTKDEFRSLASPGDMSAALCLEEAIQTLSPREQLVISMRYGFRGNGAHHLGEISEEIGVGKERVRQIEMRALRKLKGRLKAADQEGDGMPDHFRIALRKQQKDGLSRRCVPLTAALRKTNHCGREESS